MPATRSSGSSRTGARLVSENEYGVIKSHKIVAARISGNVLLLGIRINGLKSKNLFLNYDPKTHVLGFSPVELYLGP